MYKEQTDEVLMGIRNILLHWQEIKWQRTKREKSITRKMTEERKPRAGFQLASLSFANDEPKGATAAKPEHASTVFKESINAGDKLIQDHSGSSEEQ